MNTFKKKVALATVLVSGMLACSVASATVVHVMNFNGFDQGGEMVNQFYNGGCAASAGGINPNPPATPTCGSAADNYGTSWTGALAGDTGATGLFSNTADAPSPTGVMTVFNVSTAYMDVAGGFNTGFSFYYAQSNQNFTAGVITIYSGLDGTGSVLATLPLVYTGSDCVAGITFSCWKSLGVSFNGVAKSAGFGGTQSQIVFDDVTFGTANAGGVPEPAELGMFGFGLLLMGGFVALRRRLPRKA